MGIAEIIPGVSGGTIAFITGIYERFLGAIKSWNLHALALIFKGKFKELSRVTDAPFMGTLLVGMALGMIIGVFSVTYLMEFYIEPLWGFFFGLILASVFVIFQQLESWGIKGLLWFHLGIAVAILIVSINQMSGSTAPWYIFLSGFIAISALLLPGISGSFMLLVLGMYTVIIPAFRNILVSFDLSSFKILSIFGVGLFCGLLVFSRVIGWTLQRYRQTTLLVLTGFMAGSLKKIWPWRMPVRWFDKSTSQHETDLSKLDNVDFGELQVIEEKMVLPNEYTIDNPKTFLVIIAFIFGFLLVWLVNRYFGEKKDQNIPSSN